MSCRILCDFDGTIALGDVTDMLLDAFADPSWRDVEALWKAGEIGSAACMARQVALMRCGRDALHGVLDRVTIDPGFRSFVAYCRQEGLSLTVVSDGIDYAIHHILRRAEIDGIPVIANRLLFLDQERHALLTPHASARCVSAAGTCKCAVAKQPDDGRLTVLIGDGRSDFCAADTVDFVLAKSSLLDHCRANALPHAAFGSFSEIPHLLARHLPVAAGRPASAAPAALSV
ncbi:MtnX-like HAD-IB family phosphatase [Zavarzinia compransoris]|nr:MtnX-like HAD-IB family phosphatase [Zavarzinia compransoris]TDP46392.1 HAD superfamily phosphoserine phosphatase-like hydrolase/2,3-diketo-5-methylthio-1-phosphopentane phosphatase [Zavarzinia compransoris]